MKQEIQTAWVAALESGDYKQGRHRLCAISETNERSYCCLGVLIEVCFAQFPEVVDGYRWEQHGTKMYLVGPETEEASWGSLPVEFRRRVELGSDDQDAAINWNDDAKLTFPEIAGRITRGEWSTIRG